VLKNLIQVYDYAFLGQSGLKQVRLNNEGTKAYHAESFLTGKRIASIHDHSNNVRTVGIGEIIAVMNGVEFRTRHNDYRLYMPGNTTEYHATQNIPFPEVPPEVLALEDDVPKAVDEMIEWFKAWRDQDYSVRDYRKYFKPILCYMEGSILFSEALNLAMHLWLYPKRS
jgi:hypothetical protein